MAFDPKNKVRALARQYVLTPPDVLHNLAPAPSGGVSEVSTARSAERASEAEAQREIRLKARRLDNRDYVRAPFLGAGFWRT